MMFLVPAFALCGTLLFAPQTILQAPSWHALPTEVSGTARGLYALPVDAAAAGELPGAALQLRHVGTPAVAGTGALALSAGVPLGPISLTGGYAWANLPDPKAAMGHLGVSLRLHERLRFGVQLGRYKPLQSFASRSVLDVGLLWQPHRMLSASLGADAVNAPGFTRHVRMRRALRLGLGFRPLLGSSWLTLGADARLTYAAGAHLPDVRALIDLSPYEGLHLLGSYRRTNGQHTAWAGISLDMLGLELLGAGRAVAPVTQTAANRMALALTWQNHDHRSLPIKLRRELHLDVAGDLMPRARAPWQPQDAVAVLPARLAELAKQSDVARLVLHMGTLNVGFGLVGELRAAIARARAAGIEVVAHLQVADTKTYLVAAAAQTITMDPVGTLDIKGPSLQQHHLADALGRLGLRVEAVAAGRFKTAPDMFTQSAPRAEELEVGQSIVQNIYRELLAAIMHDRGLSEAAAHAALAAGPLNASRAKNCGLIDSIAVRPGGQAPPEHVKLPQEHRASLPPPRGHEPIWGPGPRIALIPVSGVLVQEGQSMPGLGQAVSASSVVGWARRAQEDASVKGVVVRIDSPGGDVVASEEVFRALQALARDKPLAVSMGDVAASGGYWAALAAPKIFADPMTLTGSIGIYSLKLDASGLLEKVGAQTNAVAAGERAGAGVWQRPLDQAERVGQQRHLNTLYDLFVDRVAQGRHLTRKRAQELAQGRVYTGQEAQRLGLVDAMGGLHDAIAWVAHEAGVDGDAALSWQAPRERASWPPVPAGLAAWTAFVQGTASSNATGRQSLESLHGMLQGPQALAPLWVAQVL